MNKHYSVIAGNIGTIYDGDSRMDALKAYRCSVDDSRSMYGRIANESVCLLRDGEPIKEHLPLPLWECELTDTFGDQANYCWVRRYRFTMPQGASDNAIMRKARKVAGIHGRARRTESYGDNFAIWNPAGDCIVLFVNYVEFDND